MRHVHEPSDPGEQDVHKGIYRPAVVRAKAAIVPVDRLALYLLKGVDIASDQAMDATSSVQTSSGRWKPLLRSQQTPCFVEVKSS